MKWTTMHDNSLVRVLLITHSLQCNSQLWNFLQWKAIYSNAQCSLKCWVKIHPQQTLVRSLVLGRFDICSKVGGGWVTITLEIYRKLFLSLLNPLLQENLLRRSLRILRSEVGRICLKLEEIRPNWWSFVRRRNLILVWTFMKVLKEHLLESGS